MVRVCAGGGFAEVRVLLKIHHALFVEISVQMHPPVIANSRDSIIKKTNQFPEHVDSVFYFNSGLPRVFSHARGLSDSSQQVTGPGSTSGPE